MLSNYLFETHPIHSPEHRVAGRTCQWLLEDVGVRQGVVRCCELFGLGSRCHGQESSSSLGA